MKTAYLVAIAFPFVLALALAFALTISKRASIAWAMQNQVYTGTPTSRRQVVLPAAQALLAFANPGQPILVGTEPAFTLDSYQSTFGGCTCLFNGSFSTTIIGRSANSPLVTAKVNPGDPLYAGNTDSGWTYDAATNIWYGGILDKNIAGIPFGHYDPAQVAIAAGVTNTAGVVQI
jgi:hypothetical protein